MRRLGAELGVEAMSLYKHVANKEAILDGIVDLVVSEIEIPSHGDDWKEAMRRRAHSARAVLTRHSWAIALMEGRGATGPAGLSYVNAILGNLRSAGFSIENAAHAFWLLDCYVYGHVIQETSMPINSPEEATDSTAATNPDPGVIEEYPHLVEIGDLARKGVFSFDGEFAFGLDLILVALDKTATSAFD
jgi:AcrR family transcriptional regulator